MTAAAHEPPMSPRTISLSPCTKVIDAYRKDLDRREANAEKAGRVFPKTLYIALYRPTEMSLQFIRWIRMHLANRTCYRRSLDALRPLMTNYL